MQFDFSLAGRLAQQVLVITIIMALGIFIRKRKMVSLEAARMFSNVMLVVVIPILLVNIFVEQKTHPGMFRIVLLGLGLAGAFHLLAILVAKLAYPKLDDKTVVQRLLVICSNCGFMGIPLITAAVGKEGVIYAAFYICAFTVYNWIHAPMILLRTKSISLKAALCSPGVISSVIGLAIFLLGIQLPYAITESMSMVSAMNTPLPTMIMGMFVADISIKEAFKNKQLFSAVFLRLLGMPLLFLAICWVIQVHRWFPGSDMAAFVLMICCACSGAISVILLPAKYGGGDEGYGGALVLISNLCSIVTIPFVVTLAKAVFGISF